MRWDAVQQNCGVQKVDLRDLFLTFFFKASFKVTWLLKEWKSWVLNLEFKIVRGFHIKSESWTLTFMELLNSGRWSLMLRPGLNPPAISCAQISPKLRSTWCQNGFDLSLQFAIFLNVVRCGVYIIVYIYIRLINYPLTKAKSKTCCWYRLAGPSVNPAQESLYFEWFMKGRHWIAEIASRHAYS